MNNVNSTVELDDLCNSSTDDNHGYGPDSDTSGTREEGLSVTSHR